MNRVYRRYFILLELMENPEPPPTIEAGDESPIVEPRHHRTAIGWLLLVIILLLYVVGKMSPAPADSTKAPSSRSKNPYSLDESSIRFGMNFRSVIVSMVSSGSPSALANKTEINPETLERLEQEAKVDPRAARLNVAAKFEAGKAITKDDLEILEKDDSAGSWTMDAIYSADKLDVSEATRYVEMLPKNEFAYKLAKVHAYEKAGEDSARFELSPVWKGLVIVLAIAVILAICVAGVTLWIIYSVKRSSGLLAPLGHPSEPMSRAEADRFAFRAGMLIAAFLAIGTVGQFTVAYLKIKDPATPMFWVSLAMLLVTIAMHKVPALGLPITLDRIGVNRRHLGKNILWGLGGYVAMIPIVLFGAMVSQFLTKFFGQPTHPAAEMIQGGASLPTILAIYFGAAIVAPFWEEVMFRGTLMPAIGTVLRRPLWGILISSFIFASIHPQGITMWLALGSIGAMSGLLAYQTKSLVPSIVLHAVNNTLVVLLGVVMAAGN